MATEFISVGIGKMFILLVLVINLLFFTIKELRKKKEIILMAVLLTLLSLGTLLNLLTTYSDEESLVMMSHLVGVGMVGMTTMLIAISSNLRMKRVMKNGIKLIHNHN